MGQTTSIFYYKDSAQMSLGAECLGRPPNHVRWASNMASSEGPSELLRGTRIQQNRMNIIRRLSTDARCSTGRQFGLCKWPVWPMNQVSQRTPASHREATTLGSGRVNWQPYLERLLVIPQEAVCRYLSGWTLRKLLRYIHEKNISWRRQLMHIPTSLALC